MSAYTGQTPDTPRAPDWRDDATCLTEDPELFFPKGYDGPWQFVIEEAKAVCRRCPSAAACLSFALDESVDDGIFGGLTVRERRSLRRSVRRGTTAPQNIEAKADAARRPRQERTLQTLFDDNTVRLHDGHLAWTGSSQLYFGGDKYTPRQLAFVVDRGRRPQGPVLSDCGSSECLLPAHITDQSERGLCGTRNGYQWHRRNGEEACGPCRKANTDANNRLRRTGTTKQLVG